MGKRKVSTFAPAIERDAVIKDNENKNFQENLEGIKKKHYLCTTFSKNREAKKFFERNCINDLKSSTSIKELIPSIRIR